MVFINSRNSKIDMNERWFYRIQLCAPKELTQSVYFKTQNLRTCLEQKKLPDCSIKECIHYLTPSTFKLTLGMESKYKN